MSKVRVSAVSYLNTLPFISGIQNSHVYSQIDLALDYPSQTAQKLLNGQVDLALVPVGVLPLIPSYHFVTNFGIGCTGKVDTVCLVSDVPIEQVTKIFLDYQSRTSVKLLQLLLKTYWNLKPQLIPAYPNYEREIKDQTAGLIIGDRMFSPQYHRNYCYDLGEIWMNKTGLPFIFAAWVSTQKLSDEFIDSFGAALQSGIDKIEDLTISTIFNEPMAKHYLKHTINHSLTPLHKRGLELFLTEISNN